MNAHSCQYCEPIFVDMPESRDGYNFKYISGFRLDVETVKAAVQAHCNFFHWALSIKKRLLDEDLGDIYLDNHIADLPGIFANGVVDELTEYEEFEGVPGSDLEQTNTLSATKPYLKLYLQCYSFLYQHRCWVSRIMARSDKVAIEEFAIFGSPPQLELVAADGTYRSLR
jgi:hypothetical protein